jgi:hypothetical protein
MTPNESIPMKRKPVKKSVRKSNPARKPKVSDQDMAHYRKTYPRGTAFFSVTMSHAPSGTRVVKFLTADAKNSIYAVPPGIAKVVGYRYSDAKGGFIFSGGGYSASDEFVSSLGYALYGDDKAFKNLSSV